MRRLTLGLAISLVALAGTSQASVRQMQVSGFEFALVDVADSGAYFVYAYELSNSVSSTWAIGSVSVDISASSGTPPPLAPTGDVFDGTQVTGATQILRPYAEVGPISPAPWTAWVKRTAVLDWSPPQPGYESDDSVSPGDTLPGFGIRSSYLPGIVAARASPTLQACCSEPADSTDPDGEFDVPESFSVLGATVGPKYKPAEVDIDLLQDQLDTVCDDPLWIRDTSLCTELADSLDAAEDRLAIANLEGAREALYGVAGLIELNVHPLGDIELPASYLLGTNLTQLLENIGH